jgi:hypothetical protein
MSYRLAALVLGAACVLGCSDAGVLTPGPDGGTASVQFDEQGVLALAPKESAVIDLSAAGAAHATLSLVGNYLDAFLDTDTVDVSSGHAEVTLHAPSSPTTFSVLATAAQATARLDVSVSATGFATVRVTVDYQGKRPVPIVTFVETTCAQLTGGATDGSPLVLGTYGEKLVIPSVPTDGQVAVAVRIAHYAVGCVDVPFLVPDDTDDVTVSVFDLPLDLASSTLESRFTFTPDAQDQVALTSYFEQVVGGAVLSASFPSSSTEVTRLLDEMSTASNSATQFASARSQDGWDTTVSAWLAQHTPSMHDRASKWLTEAAQAGVGDLTGHIGADASKPVFTPKMLGAIDAQIAGVSAPLPFAWTGQANDVLSISGDVSIAPSQLACAEADLRARADVQTATGVADALSQTIDCSGLGAALAQSGYAFGTCDASCMADLCATAIADLWTAGTNALAKSSDVVTLSLSVAAPAQVGDTAQVEGYAGSWVGSFAYGTSQVGTKGVAKGAYGTLPN